MAPGSREKSSADKHHVKAGEAEAGGEARHAGADGQTDVAPTYCMEPCKHGRRDAADMVRCCICYSPNRPISKKLGLKNDLANFLSVHLTNPYSDNMAGPQQTRRHSPPRRQKVRISFICHERIGANLTIASRGISNESVGAKFTRNR